MRPSLYIHVPFCHSKCYYCDFCSRPLGKSGNQLVEKYVNAVVKEYETKKTSYNPKGMWHTAYIGGGTPSILESHQLKKMFAGLGLFDGTSQVMGEFTVEANPEDISPEWLTEIKSLGANRVSMGVQSLNDPELKAIGRRHNATTAHRAMELLALSGLDFSVDLIYGLPGQTLEGWLSNLKSVTDYNPGHLSAYMLSFESGTVLGKWLEEGKCSEASDGLLEDMYTILCHHTRSMGYEHYEVSNFARHGKRAVHNSAYWEGRPYLGLGPGAHSFNGTKRSYNPPDTKHYIESLEKGRDISIVEDETTEQMINDIVITSLRTSEGLDFNRLNNYDDSFVQNIKETAMKLCSDGLLTWSGNHIRIPEEKWLVSDYIFRDLILVS